MRIQHYRRRSKASRVFCVASSTCYSLAAPTREKESTMRLQVRRRGANRSDPEREKCGHCHFLTRQGVPFDRLLAPFCSKRLLLLGYSVLDRACRDFRWREGSVYWKASPRAPTVQSERKVFGNSALLNLLARPKKKQKNTVLYYSRTLACFYQALSLSTLAFAWTSECKLRQCAAACRF